MTPLQTEQLLYYMFNEIPCSEMTKMLGVSRQSFYRMRNNILSRSAIRNEIAMYHDCIKALQKCPWGVTDGTGLAQVGTPNSEVAPSIEISKDISLGSKAKDEKKKTRGTSSKSWTVVPSSWEPNNDHREKALKGGVDFDRELQAFREWEFRTPKRNADMAFHRWLTKAAKEAPSKPQDTGFSF